MSYGQLCKEQLPATKQGTWRRPNGYVTPTAGFGSCKLNLGKGGGLIGFCVIIEVFPRQKYGMTGIIVI